MPTPREKFQSLLRELFQFDAAELDFGIYRIMNHKRAVIERFIEKDLLDAVSDAFKQGAAADQDEARRREAELRQEVIENLGAEALDAEGNLIASKTSPLGKRYLEARELAKGAKSTPELESAVFNHLHAFFSRYYSDGDFMSLRRYSRREKYAIPYNGEEVYLHWANSDQYYIKSGENFTDYSYRHGGWTIAFKLRNADVEQNNVKGAKRLFVPRSEDISSDTTAQTFTVPFEFRPLTSDEEARFGKTKVQDAITAEAVPAIEKAAAKMPEVLVALAVEKRRDADGQPISMLAHHLRVYTRKNTSDFFIHKDLQGFLERELDFYLKNEVLNVDELEVAGESRAEGWFQLLRTIKSIGHRIILFLAQIEDLQKRLFEKKKFVTETHFCVTLDRIPKKLYPEIATNKAQLEEWKRLLAIDQIQPSAAKQKVAGPAKAELLKSQPHLVLDTRFFSEGFIDTLLSSNEFLAGGPALDEALNGLLIHGDNFQALNLLRNRYRRQIQCIHIDPPYNTQTSGFLYKNSYQHSSWLAMMAMVTQASAQHLTADGAFLCHVDENEYERLYLLFDAFGLPNGGTIVWDKKNPMLGRKGVATQHEYVAWRTFLENPIYLSGATFQLIIEKAREISAKRGGVTESARKEFATWVTKNPILTGGEKAYRFIDDDGQVYRGVAMGAPEPRTDPKFHIPLIHPVTGKPCPVPPNGWSRSPDTLQCLIEDNEILFGSDESVQPQRKVFLTAESQRQISSVIQDASRGKGDLEKMGLEFPYCHPVSLYVQLLGAAATDSNAIICDFFAGSGTNGQAVINLNRVDDTQRKYVLVEVGEHFATVLKPRMIKAIYSEDWKDGRPVSRVGSSHCFKYLQLESYEDALDNIVFEEPGPQATFQLDDYVVNYMLDFETRDSGTLLSVKMLDSPFDYKLKRHGKDEPLAVDIAETFNYLIGLHVTSRRALDNNGLRYLVYRGKAEGRETVIIWRTTRGWKEKEFEVDRQFILDQKLIDGAEDIFVNTDSFVEGARSLDPVFKRRMFNEE